MSLFAFGDTREAADYGRLSQVAPFPASDDSSEVKGEIVTVNGGRTVLD